MTLDEIVNHNPFVIGEIGSNWSTFEDCIKSIEIAKECGANAAKFQLFTHEALFGVPTNISKIGILPLEWLPLLSAHCEQVGIEFMVSAFSPELLDVVNPHVRIHKLASSEMAHLRMLEKLKSYGKPVIMSTGSQSAPDIGRALRLLGKENVILMYCVGAYPANDVDLRTIDHMSRVFEVPVGYSDHSLDVHEIPHSATFHHDACVIEKHFNAVGATGPDSPHSLNPKQFTRMVKRIRGNLETSIGPTEAEHDMVCKHLRRLIVTRDVEVGEKLNEGQNFGIYRSLESDSRGAHPFLAPDFEGKQAKVRLSRGQGLARQDVE